MRLFVAVVPPADVLAVVAALPRPEVTGVRWSSREQWHVTLRFLGEVDDPEPVVTALDSVALPPATAALGAALTILGRSVLVMPVTGVDDLAAAVVAATAGLGRPPDDRPFRGHLTLARARRGVSLRGLPERLARARSVGEGAAGDRSAGALAAGALAAEGLAATFPVRAVRLVRSHLGAGGARYEDLAVWPLADAGRGP